MDHAAKKLLERILDKLILIQRLASEEISFDKFSLDYLDFFYFEALDGHEDSKAVEAAKKSFPNIVGFLEKVQYLAVDKVYAGGGLTSEDLIKFDRMTKKMAQKKIQKMAETANLRSLIEELSEYLSSC